LSHQGRERTRVKVGLRIKKNTVVEYHQKQNERERKRETVRKTDISGKYVKEEGRDRERKRERGTKCSSRFCDAGTAMRAIDASTRFELLSLELLKSVTDTH